MKVRRTHSSIDNLPATLQKSLREMLVDNIWPEDFEGKKTGNPRYKDLEFYCKQKNYPVSHSAIGRFGKQMAVIAMMIQRSLISKTVLNNLSLEDTGQTQRAVAELLTAKALDLTATDKPLSARQIKDAAQGVSECVKIGIKAVTFNQQQLQKNAQATAKNTKEKLTNAGVDRAKVQEIVDDILGITKS